MDRTIGIGGLCGLFAFAGYLFGASWSVPEISHRANVCEAGLADCHAGLMRCEGALAQIDKWHNEARARREAGKDNPEGIGPVLR